MSPIAGHRQESSDRAAYSANSVEAAAEVISPARADRISIIVYNNHATQILYIGTDAGVDANDGMPVGPGKSITIDNYTGALYAIGSGAGTDVRILEVG